MSDEKRDDFDEDAMLMEKFLDGLMTDSEAESFMANFEDSDKLVHQRELQNTIDDSLKQVFKFDSLDVDSIEAKAAESFVSTETKVERQERSERSTVSNSSGSRASTWVKLAIAASLLFAVGMTVFQFYGPDIQTAFFKPRPLTEIYAEAVQRGFRPYYFCDEPKRFAETFEFRHNQPLALAMLPDGSRMLGISYLGGVSRTTTAMLCEVDNEKVLVFVDNEANDQREIAMVNSDSDLNVFVGTRRGLVFYEVSPLDESRMIEHLEFVD